MPEMVDRVAKIVGSEKKAREVIAAMREPTTKMHSYGDRCRDEHSECAYRIWETMIDGALEKPYPYA